MDQSRPIIVYFRSFLIPITISIIKIEKSVDGVLGIRTQGHRMVGEDETTELWRPPRLIIFNWPFTVSFSFFLGPNKKHKYRFARIGSAPLIDHRLASK